jgi:ADP-ribose pyrophosphatase YjhB (NUDIX family)
LSYIHPRVKCVCIIKRNDSILVAEGYDRIKQERFYTPLGGEIRFGELGHAAVERELEEEIGAKVADIEFIGTLENIFTFQGIPGHEIVLAYRARFIDLSFYERALIEGSEDSPEHGGAFKATWEPLSRFMNGRVPLYPNGLLNLIRNQRI